ncbi:hypothetical protein CEUSTIGMA_g666.t1 [Chlamydomonas eustigma]|uniref:Peptidase M20 dimerisation domain-containing protein n=1 Tax=Chlamydomonas eustigma TaxID=1157962 RepID=A0A250WQX3_9CHLO|nr:hypothetical protein CEUSTIGMA_g666.t1 [Chlamydomonas eustigma]|eukprot:GAX73213.1 hypothetical protein CEUSTIGMA_g666.t1 [Chlamydomonas eustigma]
MTYFEREFVAKFEALESIKLNPIASCLHPTSKMLAMTNVSNFYFVSTHSSAQTGSRLFRFRSIVTLKVKSGNDDATTIFLLQMPLLTLGIAVSVFFAWLLYQYDPAVNPPSSLDLIACPTQNQKDAVHRFSKFLQFPSLGDASAPFHVKDEAVFKDMISHLSSSYSLVWSTLDVEMVGNGSLSLLLTWRGSDPSLLPVLLISHYDVVPVTPGTEGDWSYPPFSGAVEEGYIWGRGALDVKFSAACILEALTSLIQAGKGPRRTIMLAVGHDEEITGTQGAFATAELLQYRGLKFEAILDEGGIILSEGIAPFTQTPVAIIGTSEKVSTTVEISILSAGGHSSMPQTDNSDVGTQVAKLITHVKRNPFKSSLKQPVIGFLKALVPYCKNKLLRVIMIHCDSWPMSWLISTAFSFLSRETAAMVRTTTAVVNLAAGVADNVLPQQGSVRYNIRSHPAETSHDKILSYMNKAMTNLGVNGTVKVLKSSNFGPVPTVSSSEAHVYQAMKQAIQELWHHHGSSIAVAPYLMMGGTDSKFYAHLSENGVYRFCPQSINRTNGDLDRIHGTDERVSITDFLLGICTYRRMLDLIAVDI